MLVTAFGDRLVPRRLGIGFRWLRASSWVTNLGDGVVLAAGPVLVRLEAGGTPLLARITRFSRDQLQLHAGQVLWAQIKAVAVLA